MLSLRFLALCARRCLAIVRVATVVTSISVLAGAPSQANNLEDSTVVRIEEDWKLIVTDPSPESSGPQVQTVMLPTGDGDGEGDGISATFLINHRNVSRYYPGGMQVCMYNNESLLTSRSSSDTEIMNTMDETVTWTQAMSLEGDRLKFEVINGQSSTWGKFGGAHLRLMHDTRLLDLNGYHPDHSIDNSGVPYAAHRVGLFALERVRLFTADGQVFEDATLREVPLVTD